MTIDDRRYGTPPMPWIGFYAAVACVRCYSDLLGDSFDGFYNGKFWFSSKYFTLNATSLTVLAISTKLLFDISTPMPGDLEQASKLYGAALICISMGHFMPSIGAMEDSQVMGNVVSLTFLVITVIVNVCIQMGTGVIYAFLPHHIITLIFMLIMLLINISAALSIPTMKRSLKQQYQLKHPEVYCKDSELSNDEAVFTTFARLKNDLRKWSMMALSCNPRYVLRRSCLGAASDILCLLEFFVTVDVSFRIKLVSTTGYEYSSDYKGSIGDICLGQVVAIAVGAVHPFFRMFVNGCLLRPLSKFNDDLTKEFNGEIQVDKSWLQMLVELRDRLVIGFKEHIKVKISLMKRFLVAFKVAFRIESYWIQSFLEWEDIEIRLPTGYEHRELIYLRRFINHTKNLFLEVGRCLQILVVVFCKLMVNFVHLALLLAFIPEIVIFILKAIGKMQAKVFSIIWKDSSLKESAIPLDTKRELRNFVLHLEGEDGLVDWIFETCYFKGRTNWKWMRRLVDLLKVSIVSQGFKGLAPLGRDCVQTTGSGSQGPPNDWALPLVTLTSIAAAIPGTDRSRIRSLLHGVNEGLYFVRLIEHKLNSKGMANTEKAVDIIWQGVLTYRRWLDVDLTALAQEQKDPKKVLEHLAENGDNYLVEFEKSLTNVREDWKSGVEWPTKVLAGISMHRICRNLLRGYSNFSADKMFEWLQVLISDMLGACLTNLPRSLYLGYVNRSFDAKGGYSVWAAEDLLGETEKILEALGKGGNEDLVVNQCKYIDHWHSFMLHPSTLPSSISNGNMSRVP